MTRVAAVLFVMLLTCAVPAQEDPRIRELIQKLDDDSIDVRARSAAALSKLGREAIPALRRAAADAGTERRDRIAEIIRKIEDRERLAALLPPPTLITLEAKDRPLKEVFQGLAKQSRTPIDLTAVPGDARVSVSIKRMPFWIALEEICRASGRVMAAPEGDHVVITAEPYVALPQRITDLFRVSLTQVDLLSNGSFGQPDRFEHFTASFQVSWEKGAKPWRIVARIEELVDDHGDDLIGAGGEPELSPYVAAGPIEQLMQVDCQHGPGPQAVKLARLKVEFDFEFPLRYAEVRLGCVDGKLSPESECPEFSAQLLRMERQDKEALVTLRVTPGASPAQGDVHAEGVLLRDSKGVDHPATIRETSQTPEGDATYQFSFADVPDPSQYKEIIIRVPAEIHRERVDVDLKDVPLK